jgi:5,6,7,8-tetrahydromethanopterin hydro-lyase
MGEGFAGTGVDAVHVDTVVGSREGPVGTAWATALATPSPGHRPFVVVARPGLPVVPLTLFVNEMTIASERHATLTWGAAHAGVAAGVLDVRLPDNDGQLCIIAAVRIDPEAFDEEAMFANTRSATVASIELGAAGGLWTGHFDDVEVPENLYFRRDGTVT